jgi:hypothetical protein
MHGILDFIFFEKVIHLIRNVFRSKNLSLIRAIRNTAEKLKWETNRVLVDKMLASNSGKYKLDNRSSRLSSSPGSRQLKKPLNIELANN